MDPDAVLAVTAAIALAVKVIGFVVAVLGSCAAVPAATRRLVRRVRSSVVEFARRIRGRPLRGKVDLVAPNVGISASGTLTFSGSAHAAPTTLDGRIKELERRLGDLDKRLAELGTDLRAENEQRRTEIADATRKSEREIARLDIRFDDEARATEEVDARALPILLVGLVLSTFSGEFAAVWAVGIVAVVAGLVAAVRAIHLVATHREPREVRGKES